MSSTHTCNDSERMLFVVLNVFVILVALKVVLVVAVIVVVILDSQVHKHVKCTC